MVINKIILRVNATANKVLLVLLNDNRKSKIIAPRARVIAYNDMTIIGIIHDKTMKDIDCSIATIITCIYSVNNI